MWTIVGGLILIALVLVLEKRNQKRQQRDPDKVEQALAVGKRVQPFWKVWGGVSGATIIGFAGGPVVGLSEIYSSIVTALLVTLYFEKRRYPKLLISSGLTVAHVIFEDLGSTELSLDDKSQFFLDGQHLELRNEGKRKQIVLFRQDFPGVDFDTLWQWLTDIQKDRSILALRKATTIKGFRASEGLLDLLSPREAWSSRPLFLFVWVGLLMQLMARVFK